jgi:type VI secretion system protein ImpB
VAKQSSQKFIARNRAPRVQIEYDVEVYGSQKKVQLPFVMGVMADLSGKPVEPLPAVADRKFLEIDIDNFDQRMKAMKPRVAFAVPNTLTGEGNLQVDITFESMEDFSPAAIARKVEPLRKLLETRTQLSNLMTYMDGKTGAEELIGKLLGDPTLLQALGSAPNPAAARAAAPPPVQQAAPVAAAAIAAPPEELESAETAEPEAPMDTSPSADGDGSDDLDSLLDELN